MNICGISTINKFRIDAQAEKCSAFFLFHKCLYYVFHYVCAEN